MGGNRENKGCTFGIDPQTILSYQDSGQVPDQTSEPFHQNQIKNATVRERKYRDYAGDYIPCYTIGYSNGTDENITKAEFV